jgi:transposase-like protein
MGRPRNLYREMSLLEFQNRFPDEQSCWNHVVKVRWPEGRSCPKCRKAMGTIRTRQMFQCKKCRVQVSATAGTMFHKTRLPLRKWFWAIFLMGTTSKGVSMLYLQKQLGIKNYRTEWLLGHKIRRAMMQREDQYKLRGKVEVEQMQIGHQSQENRAKIREDRRTRFLMAIQEGQKGNPRFVKFEELESFFKEDLIRPIEKRIEKGSTLKSDGDASYLAAKEKGYQVESVVFDKEPDKAKDHLKWIHWVSSNTERGLVSTYHGCFPKYRKAYLAEFAYRFNRRYWPHQAFDRLLTACILGKKITLDELTA